MSCTLPLPLLLFAYGAQRIRLATMGLLQYVSPTVQLLLGTLVYREAFESFRFGTAAAIGVLMLATAGIFVALSMRALREEFR